MLEVDRKMVIAWVYHFSDYLGPKANPPKGSPRTFTADDLRVMSYVYMYWEENPDLECIKAGLNSGDHFEKPFEDMVTIATPIFQDPPDALDETWRHGTIIGGMAPIADLYVLAESYKLAGDILIDAALSTDEAFELIYPIIYNYRHATELYLKSTLQDLQKYHDLLRLLQQFKTMVKVKLNSDLPQWFIDIVTAFHDFDPNSTTFRYGGFDYVMQRGEMWVDLNHMKTVMGWLSEAFQKVRHAEEACRANFR
ncbi:MAG: hypothetical protein P4L51_20480 [Puia sp.]|nr:hypothetical protein [Puia sp.]